MTSDGALAFTHWKMEVFDQGMAQPPGIDDTFSGSPGRESAAPASATAAPTSGQRTVELRVGPLADPSQADNLVDLFKEITNLGTIEPLDGGRPDDGIRRFKFTADFVGLEPGEDFGGLFFREQQHQDGSGLAAGDRPAAFGGNAVFDNGIKGVRHWLFPCRYCPSADRAQPASRDPGSGGRNSG